MPLDVRRLGCHALAGTSRKYLRGPRGVGVLWVAREWIERLEPPLMEGHAAEWVEPDRYVIRPDAKRFEVWESNVGARLGFGAAIAYAQALGLPRIWARVQMLAETLRAIGIEDTPKNLSNKVAQGKFSAAFFMQCMTAIGCHIRIDEE